MAEDKILLEKIKQELSEANNISMDVGESIKGTAIYLKDLLGQGKESEDQQKKTASEEKRTSRSDKKSEGGRLTRAKASIKSAAAQMSTLKGIGSGIKGLGKGLLGGLKGLGGKGMKGMGGMFSLIMKGAMLALLPALLLFFNSPLWTKTKKFLLETALPAVMKFYNDAIVPAFNFLKDKILPIFMNLVKFLKDEILPIFTVYIVKTWNNIKVLFTDISDAFRKIFSGDILGGLMDLICGIGKFIGKQINAIMTAIYNIIAKIFGLKETDSVFGSIGGFFKDMKDKVVGYISGGWNFIKEKLAAAFGAITDIGDWIGGIFCKVVDWIKGIFSWGSSDEDGSWSLITFITTAFDKVKAWFLGIFSWGSTDEEEGNKFSISGFIKGVFKGIKAWFGKLFKFDSTSDVITSIINVLTFVPNLIKDLVVGVTSWLLGLFGFDDAAKKVSNAGNWSIGSFVVGVFKSIKDWFLGIFKWGTSDEVSDFSIPKFIGGIFKDIVAFFKRLFDIDFKGLAAKLIPDNRLGRYIAKKMGIVPGGDTVDEEAEAEMELESDSVTLAKIEEERQKGNIKSIKGQTDEYGGMSDALNRAQLEKEIAAGNSGGGGDIITANQVSTTKQVNSQINVQPVLDTDPIVENLARDIL